MRVIRVIRKSQFTHQYRHHGSSPDIHDPTSMTSVSMEIQLRSMNSIPYPWKSISGNFIRERKVSLQEKSVYSSMSTPWTPPVHSRSMKSIKKRRHKI